MKNKLTFALLFAGLFLSGNVYANNCEALAGQEVSVISFETECPFTTTIDVGGDKCILEPKSRAGQSEFVCTLASGTWMGGPWQYTGGRQVESNEPLDPPQTPPPLELPEWSTETPSTVSSSSYYANTYSSLKNMTERLNSISSYLSNDSLATQTAISTSAASTQNYVWQQSTGIRRELTNYIANVDNKVQTVLNNQQYATVMTLEGLASLSSENRELHKKTHDNQELEKLSFQQVNDQLTSLNASAQYGNGMINEIWNVIGISGSSGGCGGFDCPPSYTLSQMLQINQQQLLDALASGGSGDSEETQLLSSIEANTYDSYTKLRDVEELLESIDEKTGTGGSGGSGSDMTATNEKLDAINNTLQSNNANLSSQLAQQLDEIEAAIKDSPDGGSGGVDPDVNEKLDTLIQNTALAAHNAGVTNDNVVRGTAAIGGKLDAIGQDVSDLTDAFDAGTGKQDGPALCTGDDCYKGKSWITPKYPDGLTSIYENHKLAFQESDIHTYLQGFNPVISGAAPSEWRFCVDVGIANLGCHSLELPPYILSFVRLCILITAGFLCRRLIFGG